MIDFTITECAKQFTIKEVFDFIDDTNIGKMDSCELKSRIVDAVQAERNKVINEFEEAIRNDSNYIFDYSFGYVIPIKDICKIAEKMRYKE